MGLMSMVDPLAERACRKTTLRDWESLSRLSTPKIKVFVLLCSVINETEIPAASNSPTLIFQISFEV
jgi:hypothetical protein